EVFDAHAAQTLVGNTAAPGRDLVHESVGEGQEVTVTVPPPGKSILLEVGVEALQVGLGGTSRGAMDQEVPQHDRPQYQSKGPVPEASLYTYHQHHAGQSTALADPCPVTVHMLILTCLRRRRPSSRGRRSSMPKNKRACMAEIWQLSRHSAKWLTPSRG